MRSNAGFTMIEIIMVIIILGVLSAFALPRFADFGRTARIANVEAVATAFRTSASIAHAHQLVSGGAPGDPATLEGAVVTMVNGYPTPDEDGIVNAAQVSGDYDITSSGAGEYDYLVITYRGHPSCGVSYNAAFLLISTGEIIPPEIMVYTNDC